ncbi:YdcF family protein [Xylanivirga thermophila]|jgi:uncharacterized SAM-binding protein YcdF (DUF218 family)|uniref:YdcF family protein n=1 Tax=Xylanivirga thermophila TaxID=2496273 RepID=UPI00101B65D7|nr:YdcF family protein [Xylanivirga thermophila]
MRKKRAVIFKILMIFLVSFIVLESSIILFGIQASPYKADCIIILGCSVYGNIPSPLLMARLDEGLRLYNAGYADYIIVSGGKGQGENISEAQAMKEYLSKHGIDEEKIIMEDRSFSTIQNISYSKAKMDERGLRTSIIVSNKFHLKRSSIIAKRLGMDASYSGVFVKQHKCSEIKGFIREVPAVIRNAFIKKI